MPIAIPGIVGLSLLAVLAFFLMYLLRAQASHVLGGVLSFLRGIPIIGSSVAVLTADLIAKLVQSVEERWGNAARTVEDSLAGFLGATAAVIERSAYATAHLAEQSLHGLRILRQTIIPLAIHYALAPVRLAVAAVERVVNWSVREARTAEGTLAHDFRIGWKQAAAAAAAAALALRHAIAVEIPHALDWPREEIGKLWGTIDRNLTRRLTRLEKWIAGGVIAGLIVRALAKRMPWFRCGNVNRAMRQICRTPWHFMDDLLALFADFFVLTNICAVIPWLESAFALVAAPLVSTLARAGAGVCGPGSGPPATLDVPPLYLPSTVSTAVYTAE